MLRFCALLLVFSAAEGRELTGKSDYVLADAIEGPRVSGRHANSLAAGIDRPRLWDLGEVNYLIQTPTSRPNAGTPYLPENDTRIIDAIAHWEAKTCIRFTRCPTEADCPVPYFAFEGGQGCGALIGNLGITYVTLGPECHLAATVHEIGHVMGLAHEHTRSDRDNYVRIDYDQLAVNVMDRQTGFRNIGVYDYASIMHYQSHVYSKAGLPTIVTTEVIGEHSRNHSIGLSEGDIAAIDFMYNGCSATYAAPRCITNASAVLLIPHSKEFVVEINADWNVDSSMTVSYGSTNAPGAAFSIPSGTNAGYTATTFITLNPSSSDAGSTFKLAATFTSTGAGAESSTCQVEVTVATGDRVCFGISADDESVCGGGGGACTSDSGIPCLCTGQHTGKQCEEHPCTSEADSPPCYEYLMQGSLTRPTSEDLKAGGLTLTVRIAGGDTWVDSEATKQAFIDGLASASPSSWNLLKSTMMNTDLVTILGSTLTLGPLMAAGSYFSFVTTVVSLALDASMVTSGTLGVGSDDLFFVVPAAGACTVGIKLPFDDSTAFPDSVVDTSFSVEGGSAYFGRPVGSNFFSIFGFPTRDLFTTISYYVAADDAASLPGVDILGTGSCWLTQITTTGLLFDSDADVSVDMPLELNHFYFVEHVIDYSTGMMTVRVDGEVKIENFASKSGSDCISDGINSVVFLYKGWLDEFHVESACPWYDMTGSLTSPVHSELVDGGLMLTVSSNGGDTWVDSVATKQALIDGLVADSSSTALTGWNAVRSTMMNTELVTISGSKMTLGPLNPAAASFFEDTETVVSLTLDASMMTSGILGVITDLSFVVPPSACPVGMTLTFDVDSAPFPFSVVDTSFSVEGGSAYFGRPEGSLSYSLYLFPASNLFAAISYYVAIDDAASLPGVDIINGFNTCWKTQITATGLFFDSVDTGVTVDKPLELNHFNFVEHVIDYSTGMMTVRVDGVVKIENFASRSGSNCVSEGIDGVVFLNKGWLDEFDVQPACQWYEMTGSLTSPVHSELVDGGLMLTVIVGGDTWVDTEATKQALIDGLVADSSSTALTGWNALKSTMMSTLLVSISGSKMTLGPLNPAASFFEDTETVVSLTLDASMMTSGSLGDSGIKLVFVVPSSTS